MKQTNTPQLFESSENIESSEKKEITPIDVEAREKRESDIAACESFEDTMDEIDFTKDLDFSSSWLVFEKVTNLMDNDINPALLDDVLKDIPV
ncbi:MAG: hypothetical protein U9Q66_00765 [Patescibacteria group bacterium]|nr:hypothetical protein [Patescibacteria group bacterium]